MENVTLEPELEEALASASDAELCDIAGNSVTTLTPPINTLIHVHVHEVHRFHFSPTFNYIHASLERKRIV